MSVQGNGNGRNDALYGRLVNGLDDQQLWRMIPESSRPGVFEYVVAARDRANGGPPLVFGEAICDGDGALPDGSCCNDTTGLHGAAEALSVARQVPGLENVLVAPLVDTRVLTDDNFARMWEPDANVTTAEAAVLRRVGCVEHSLHAAGLRMRRRDGRELARLYIVRWMLLFELMYNVPVTMAAGASWNGSWVDAWSTLVASWQQLCVTLGLYHLCIREAVVDAVIERSSWFTSDSRESCDFWYGPSLLEKAWMWCQYWISGSAVYRTCAEDGFHLMVLDTEAYWADAAVCCLYLVVACSLCWLTVLAFRFSCACKTWFGRLEVARILRSSCRLDEPTTSDETCNTVSSQCVGVEKLILSTAKLAAQCVPTNVLEMSQKGSAIANSSHVPGLLYLMKIDGEESTPIGVAFRYADYLVTAEHNISVLISAPGTNYVVPFCAVGDKSRCDEHRHVELTNAMIESDLVPESYKSVFDIAIIPLGNRAFSRLAVSSLSATDAAWGATVTVVGLTNSGNGYLQRSVGQIVKDEEAPLHRVVYNASTAKGWSGAPVLLRRKVVAVHIGHNGKINYGLNFTVVRRIIYCVTARGQEAAYSHVTSSSIDYSRWEGSMRDDRGDEADYDDYGNDGEVDLEFLTRSKRSGRLYHKSRDEVTSWLNWQSKTGRNWADADYDDERSDLECAVSVSRSSSISRPTPIAPAQHVTALSPASPKRLEPFGYLDGTVLSKTNNGKHLSCPIFKGVPPDSTEFVDLEAAKLLGYEEGKYVWPPAKTRAVAIQRSVRALSNYLQKSVLTITTGTVPSDDIRVKAKKIWMEVMKPARIVTDCSGVTKDKIRAQIDSTLVKSSRSPGLPFVPTFQTNGEVIAHYTVDGLVDLVYQHWIDGTWVELLSVNFPKLEPTKVSKIEAGLDRQIQSVSLVVQLIFRCFLGDIHDRLKEVQGRIPVVCGWCPTNPGDAEMAVNRLVGVGKKRGRGKLLTYDGVAFEYTSHMEWNYSDVSQCTVGLYVPDKGVTDEKFQKWRSEFLDFLDKVGRIGIQCSDGTVVNKTMAAILSSGRFDTYVRNSFTGLYNDIVAKLVMGLGIDSINDTLRKALFGGDDNGQNVGNDFDLEAFRRAFASLGFPIHEVVLADPREGFEFFSWKFTFDRNDAIRFVPTRFTKHIENLLACKPESRPEALRCFMMLWVHDADKFGFFRDLFMAGNASDPESFRLELLVDRYEYLNHVQGNEVCGAGFRSPDIDELFDC